ncbi:hypothetical protein B0H11DRAFT_2297013 [Mycena galericulata]|nr:hypothetical protein B0H11DRAFT_2297013 [Mycena galericulata]
MYDELTLATSMAAADLQEALELSAEDSSDVLGLPVHPPSFDLVARLPFDISSEIFMQCLPIAPTEGPRSPAIFSHHPTPPPPTPNDAPMILLNICRRWSEIALSSPALWGNIHVDFPRSDGFEKLFETWLSRAAGSALNISLHGSFDRSILTSVQTRAERLQSLELYIRSELDLGMLVEEAVSFPSLKSLTIGNKRTANMILLRIDEVMDLLRLAPNLTECTFDNIHYALAAEHSIVDLQPLVLPHLHILNIGQYRNPSSGGPQPHPNIILQSLSLPSLRSLNLSRIPSNAQSLLEFLRRSLPPLRKLVLGRGELTQSTRDECFRIVPTLTHLELLFEVGQIFLVDLATRSRQDFLPNLVSLTIHDVLAQNTPYNDLVRALAARRLTSLRSVEVFWRETDIIIMDILARTIPEQTVTALREFVDDGMRIHIGQRQRNLLDHARRPSITPIIPRGANYMVEDPPSHASPHPYPATAVPPSTLHTHLLLRLPHNNKSRALLAPKRETRPLDSGGDSATPSQCPVPTAGGATFTNGIHVAGATRVREAIAVKVNDLDSEGEARRRRGAANMSRSANIMQAVIVCLERRASKVGCTVGTAEPEPPASNHGRFAESRRRNTDAEDVREHAHGS